MPDAFSDTRLLSKAVGLVDSAWMCKPGLVPAGSVPLHELMRHRLLVQGNASGTGRLYDAWIREQGVEPSDFIVVSNLIALTGLTVSGFGVSYLPRRCLAPLIAVGMLAVLNVTPPLPRVPYVAMYKGEQRSMLTSSIIMLAQSCCDFTKAFQVFHRPQASDHGVLLPRNR